VAVSAGDYHTVGLNKGGTVVAAGYNDGGQCNVSEWSALLTIVAGVDHTAGLTFDGKVVVTGADNEGQCNVAEWALW
jgi:alpha-tubulin suppressor-like RCC1 family protein